MNPDFLDVDDVLEIHALQTERFGGVSGVLDRGRLESAVAQPMAMFAGNFLHEDLYDMAAAYLFHIARDHPFFDGNKRTALLAALVFLEINGVSIRAEEDELEDLAVGAAEGRADKSSLARFFQDHATG